MTPPRARKTDPPVPEDTPGSVAARDPLIEPGPPPGVDVGVVDEDPPVDLEPLIASLRTRLQEIDARRPDDGPQPAGSLARASQQMIEARHALDDAVAQRDRLLDARAQLERAVEILLEVER